MKATGREKEIPATAPRHPTCARAGHGHEPPGHLLRQQFRSTPGLVSSADQDSGRRAHRRLGVDDTIREVRRSPVQGKFTYRVECTDKANPGLNGKEQTLSVAVYKGDNPLPKHGFVKTSPGQTYFEHADGTPFPWQGDSWWKCLCKRMTWEGFQELTANRKAKGFSVVQIVCGPYPDENFCAPSLENEGGQPHLANEMSVVNPQYFDFADRRFKHLVDAGPITGTVLR